MRPVCISQPHWPTFLATCKELLKVNPTDNISKKGYKLEELETFCAVCDMQADPDAALEEKYNPGYQHTFVTFLGQLDDKTINFIRNIQAVKITSYGNQVYLLTASIADWYAIVDAGLNLPGQATLFVSVREFFLMTRFSKLFNQIKLNPVVE